MPKADALPRLAALHVFVEAARAESLTRAARALHVTPGAVSRTIRALEADLGRPLFARTARAVALTPAGRAYYAEVARAFEILAHATTAARSGARLVVSLLPSFATFWLLPRLPRFEERHPDVRIDLQLSYELVDVRGGDAHVAIRYGRGQYPGARTRRLFDETLVPVASPAVARRLRGGDFWTLPLLSAGAAAPDADGDIDWGAWSEGAGRPIPGGARYRRLRDYQRVVHAARAGQGVAMARLCLVGELVEAKELVPLAEERVTGKTAHWFVCADDAAKTPAVRAFYRWLRAQA